VARILFVEDEPEGCEPIRKYLESQGHRVTFAANGRDALMQVLSNPPDLILLDLMMPDMDGPSFLEVIRSYLRLQSLPVIVLTALDDSPMIERARSLKVNSILRKGRASLDDIARAVDDVLANPAE
jgi:CheY-like chemotaxis protein